MEELLAQNSFWKPYFNIFPKNYNNFPIFYNAEEKYLLQGTTIISLKIQKHINSKLLKFTFFYLKDYILERESDY